MNHYDALGVPKNADEAAIKKAYKRKAREHHPDKGGDSRAMVAVNRAYETLSNKRKREYYDVSGEEEKLTTPEQQALQTIYQIMLSLAGQVEEQFDFVDAIVQNLRNNRDTIARKKPQLEKAMRKIENQRKCIRRKGGGENLLDRAFAQQVDAITQQLADLPAAVAICDRALTIMKDYENAAQMQIRPRGGPLSDPMFSHMKKLMEGL
jgi:curved DNA-binding protein CbpA